tara:strand:- start:402 stop:1397 length:996 start_codon:yes stop_codon:yes gene_type:complete
MGNEYLFELGGENEHLAKFEAKELLKNENYEPRIGFEETKIITFKLSRKLKADIVQRLGMTKRISRIVLQTDEKNVSDALEEINKIEIGKKSFAIRGIGSTAKSERKNAILIGEKIPKENKINLEKPDVKILYYTGTKTIISIAETKLQTAYKKCLEHHVKYRPYFSPISIHPRIARSMINLSKCSPDGIIIDPFCGTGGILIEGADIGMDTIGIDISPRMVENTVGNLKHFGFVGEIKEGDIIILKDEKFDAIVTDPPYGISSSSNKEDIGILLNRTMQIFSDSLKSGQRVVIAVSDPELIISNNFNVVHRFEWYIHKSLTRYILVLERN